MSEMVQSNFGKACLASVRVEGDFGGRKNMSVCTVYSYITAVSNDYYLY